MILVVARGNKSRIKLPKAFHIQIKYLLKAPSLNFFCTVFEIWHQQSYAGIAYILPKLFLHIIRMILLQLMVYCEHMITTGIEHDFVKWLVALLLDVLCQLMTTLLSFHPLFAQGMPAVFQWLFRYFPVCFF